MSGTDSYLDALVGAEPAAPDEAERANRRPAHKLGADMSATDAARILRPPGTSNFKGPAPQPVEPMSGPAEIKVRAREGRFVADECNISEGWVTAHGRFYLSTFRGPHPVGPVGWRSWPRHQVVEIVWTEVSQVPA